MHSKCHTPHPHPHLLHPTHHPTELEPLHESIGPHLTSSNRVLSNEVRSLREILRDLRPAAAVASGGGDASGGDGAQQLVVVGGLGLGEWNWRVSVERVDDLLRLMEKGRRGRVLAG